MQILVYGNGGQNESMQEKATKGKTDGRLAARTLIEKKKKKSATELPEANPKVPREKLYNAATQRRTPIFRVDKPPGQRLGLNRSQCGGCSTNYDTTTGT